MTDSNAQRPAEPRTVRMVVRAVETVKEQLNAQKIHVAGHITASLERSRQAILQLGAANIATPAQRKVLERRWRLAVRDTLRRYLGNYKIVGDDNG